ncbi:hypothetical protein LC771_29425, partial [Klebsiella pneumoniae]|nr:hypothetical protein [Klebsiella pneumoniae]
MISYQELVRTFQNTTRVIAVGFISLGTLLTLSLATNIIQGINNYRLQTEQKEA